MQATSTVQVFGQGGPPGAPRLLSGMPVPDRGFEEAGGKVHVSWSLCSSLRLILPQVFSQRSGKVAVTPGRETRCSTARQPALWPRQVGCPEALPCWVLAAPPQARVALAPKSQ